MTYFENINFSYKFSPQATFCLRTNPGLWLLILHFESFCRVKSSMFNIKTMVILCGNSIDCFKKMKYLGFVLTSDLKDDDDMNGQLRSIYGSANVT